jgi:YVTN family beta-propeller protein
LNSGSILKNSTIFLCGLLGLALCGCRPHDFPQYPANYREFAYVANAGSGTVSIYDVVNVRLDRELAVGTNPTAVVASPSRNEVYVLNAGDGRGPGSLAVLDTVKNAVAALIPLDRHPVSLEVSADGATAYVANAGANSVSVIDLAARRETARIGAGDQPAVARISADGKTLVVANRGGNSVSVIDTPSKQPRASFTGCPGASDAILLPDSTKAFVACSGGHQLMVLALARSARPATAQASASPAVPDRLETLLDVGHAPVHLAIKPDGGEVFSSNQLANTVSEIYNSTDEVGDTFTIGDGPVRSIVSADNSRLYVANGNSQYVTIYSIDDGKRQGSVHVGDGPSAMAFSTAGHLLFVTDQRSGDVAVVRTATRSLFTVLPAGKTPTAIAVKSYKLP